MSMKERVQLIEKTSSMSSNILTKKDENMLPSKFPSLKSKGRVLANAINRDLNRTTNHGKEAIERQRENAMKLASGRSVVDKLDKENAGVRNFKSIKDHFPSKVAPKEKINNKSKSILEEKKNKIVKSESLVSLHIPERVTLIKKEKVKPVVVVEEKKEIPKPVEEKKEIPKPVVEEKEKPKVELEPKIAKPISALNLIESEDKETQFSEILLGIYADDIHQYLKHIESSQAIRKEYLSSAHIMTKNMRSLLVDWLFEVQLTFKLLNETIHLAIALLDRFMQDHPSVPKTELQLVGVSCIFLASKYEEMYPPELDDLVDVSAKTYTKAQILKMEKIIFSSLNYQIGRPSPSHFLRRYCRAGKLDLITYCLAKYFVDLSLVSYTLCHVPPSLMAASALYLSVHILSKNSDPENLSPNLINCTEYSLDDMKPIVCNIASVVWNVPTSKYQNVRLKYLDSIKFKCVGSLQELRSNKVYNLAQKV